MATPNISYQNKFSTTLSSGITATDTTIPLTSLPTPSEGYLTLEPDSSTAWEEIYFTSKTGSAVVVPSVAAGRGQNGSTAASHSSGATVRMDTTAGMFLTIQDATALTGVHTNNSNYAFDFVSSGGVITADSAGSNKNYSITSGVAYINGRRHTFAAVSAQTVTASKDRYVDLLYSTVDNVATLVNTEVSNNAASPALASNSIRLGIVVAGATTIATAASINQGQEDRVLPIASSIPYTVTDSLGNLICPRDPNRQILGYRQASSNFTGASNNSDQDVTGLTFACIVPTGRKIELSAIGNVFNGANANPVRLILKEGSTQLNYSARFPAASNSPEEAKVEVLTSPTAGTHTYKVTLNVPATGVPGIEGNTGELFWIKAKLV